MATKKKMYRKGGVLVDKDGRQRKFIGSIISKVAGELDQIDTSFLATDTSQMKTPDELIAARKKDNKTGFIGDFFKGDLSGMVNRLTGGKKAKEEDRLLTQSMNQEALASQQAGAASQLGYKKGGKIKGRGTGKSDSIKGNLPAGTFVVPAENADIALDMGKEFLGWTENEETTLNKKGEKVAVSNGEVIFTPEEVAILQEAGIDLNALAPEAENVPGMNGVEELACGGKTRRHKMAKGGKLSAKDQEIINVLAAAADKNPTAAAILRGTDLELVAGTNALGQSVAYSPAKGELKKRVKQDLASQPEVLDAIPFGDPKAAKAFARRANKAVKRFHKILPEDELNALVSPESAVENKQTKEMSQASLKKGGKVQKKIDGGPVEDNDPGTGDLTFPEMEAVDQGFMEPELEIEDWMTSPFTDPEMDKVGPYSMENLRNTQLAPVAGATTPDINLADAMIGGTPNTTVPGKPEKEGGVGDWIGAAIGGAQILGGAAGSLLSDVEDPVVSDDLNALVSETAQDAQYGMEPAEIAQIKRGITRNLSQTLRATSNTGGPGASYNRRVNAMRGANEDVASLGVENARVRNAKKGVARDMKYRRGLRKDAIGDMAYARDVEKQGMMGDIMQAGVDNVMGAMAYKNYLDESRNRDAISGNSLYK